MVVFLLDSLRVFTIFVYVSLLNFFCSSELNCTLSILKDLISYFAYFNRAYS